MGLVTGIFLALVLFLGFGSFSTLFTTDPDVLEVAQSGLLVIDSLPTTCFVQMQKTLEYLSLTGLFPFSLSQSPSP